MRTLFSLALCLCIGLTANAQESAKNANGAVAKCGGACPVETAMKGLPKIQFKVNGKMIDGCIKCAESAAKETKKPILYVVGKKEFKAESKAKMELVTATEKVVKDFATPCKCDVSKTTTIAGKKCDCPVEADERSKLVTAAMNKVVMSYKVGDKSCDCPVEAKALSTSTGKAKEFVVGSQCTVCEVTARLELAKAKYKAALEAVAKLDSAKK